MSLEKIFLTIGVVAVVVSIVTAMGEAYWRDQARALDALPNYKKTRLQFYLELPRILKPCLFFWGLELIFVILVGQHWHWSPIWTTLLFVLMVILTMPVLALL